MTTENTSTAGARTHTAGKIKLWPTHWMGGSNAYRVNGENAPWLEFEEGGILALGFGDPHTENTMANLREMVKRWNCYDDFLALLEDALKSDEEEIRMGGQSALGFEWREKAREAIAKAKGLQP